MARKSTGGRRREGRILPVAVVERLIRKVGADRVGASASDALTDILEATGLAIAARASRIAKHSGRKTVTGSDIEMAKS
jgi:histone H3/H4